MSRIEQIGTKIRWLRKQRGLTLQQMSEAVGLSVGYLSYLERNEKSPTLINIAKICEVLETSVADLLETTEHEKVLIRRKEREITVDEENDVRIETIDFGKEYGSCLYMTMQPGGNFDGTFWTHQCHEIGTVISGKMSVLIEDETYELNPGDTILVKAHSRHCCYNKGTTPVVTYWSRFWDEGERKDEIPSDLLPEEI